MKTTIKIALIILSMSAATAASGKELRDMTRAEVHESFLASEKCRVAGGGNECWPHRKPQHRHRMKATPAVRCSTTGFTIGTYSNYSTSCKVR